VIFFLDMKEGIFWDFIAEDGSKVNRNVLDIFWNKVLKLHLRTNYHVDPSPWFSGICFVIEFRKVHKKIILLLFVLFCFIGMCCWMRMHGRICKKCRRQVYTYALLLIIQKIWFSDEYVLHHIKWYINLIGIKNFLTN